MLDWLKKWFPVNNPSFSSPSWNWNSVGWSGGPTGKGQPPSQQELATLSAVNRACTLFSDSAGSQKWQIVQSRPTGGAVTILGSDAANALNGWSFADREFWIYQGVLLGNSYAVVNRNERGGAGSIQSLASWRVSLEWLDNGALVYRVAEDESLQEAEFVVPAENMLHFKYREIGRHPLLGVAPLQSLSPALAPWFSVREGLASVYDWITVSGGNYESPEKLNLEQVNQLQTAIESKASGRPLILGNGLSAKPAPLPNLQDLQSLEMSRFGVEECARAYGLPTFMLSQTEGVNYSSAAEASRVFATTSLQPFCVRIQSVLDGVLLSRAERMSGAGASIDLTNLLIGNGTEKSEYYSRLANAGLLTPNECRNQLNMPDLEGGDVLRAPLNTAPLADWIDPEPEPAPAAARGSATVIKMLRNA